ncbi:ArsA family ATPase [Rhodococcus sp. G-MC3]|uniref:ArsA family ATPase n=1 Tax=Rhodococcus sp. G-MC3 TaxID=3046209 RepID=UPI003FA76BF9
MGKTTLAAKAALDLAETGKRALVVSLDQAHSLADVFAVAARPGTRDEIFAVQPGLDVLELDTLRLVESQYTTLTALLSMSGTGHEHGVRFGAVAPEEIIGAPGVQELLGLHQITQMIDENAWDTIFVDLPSTAEALRTLQLPELVCGYLERLWPQHDRIVAGTGSDPRLTVVVAMIERIVADAEAVRTLLFDHSRTTATVVLTPERMVVAEARRTMSAAALMGLPIDTVIVNKVLPKLNSSSVGLVGVHPAVFWFEAWRSAQQAVLDEIVVLAHGRTLVVVDRAQIDPVGLASLGVFDARIGSADTQSRSGESKIDREFGETHKRSAGKPVVAHESGSGLESIYTMTMLLPLVDASTLELGRVEDDVIIGADGHRRRVRLASVLRRCEVIGAEFDAGRLVVRFQPDPSVWPV